MKKLFLCSALMASFLAGCSDNGVVSNDVPTPRFVPRSSDTAAVERGIRAWPDAAQSRNGGIRLEWYSLRDVGGYALYRTDKLDSSTKQPVDFQKIAQVRFNQTTEDTAYVDTAIVTNKEYFYFVRAFDRSQKETEGKNSDTASFLMEGKISLLSPDAAVSAADSVKFRWDGSPGYTVLRVYKLNNFTVSRPVWVYAGIPSSFSDPYFTYNSDGKGEALEKGKQYRWRVTRIFSGGRARGAASGWKSFDVN